MKNNTLYLLKMGMDDSRLSHDIKNHRVRTIKNIDIIFNGEKYNMFFEFSEWASWRMRYTNKRTGAPLKKPITEIVNPCGLYIDTQFERQNPGEWWTSSYRLLSLEKEVYADFLDYSKAAILEVINRYSVEKYNRVEIIDHEEAERITREEIRETAKAITTENTAQA